MIGFLRRDKEVGARLKRIPKELVDDVIKQALDTRDLTIQIEFFKEKAIMNIILFFLKKRG